ncbi:MAG TPA: hypothetical protein VM925_32605 [Labilithrix sp.]|nr:hypothetical protein [Labilithrix sp.]
MSDENELEGWRREWQSLGGRERLAEELARRVARDGRRIRLRLAVEVTAGIVVLLLAGMLVIGSHGEAVNTVGALGIVFFGGVWLTRLFLLRQGSLRSVGTALDTFVDLTRRRLADDARWAAFSLRAMHIMGLTIVVWGVWAFFYRYAMYRAEPWRAIVGFGGVTFLFGVSYLGQRRKRVRVEEERAHFERLVAERTLE